MPTIHYSKALEALDAKFGYKVGVADRCAVEAKRRDHPADLNDDDFVILGEPGLSGSERVVAEARRERDAARTVIRKDGVGDRRICKVAKDGTGVWQYEPEHRRALSDTVTDDDSHEAQLADVIIATVRAALVPVVERLTVLENLEQLRAELRADIDARIDAALEARSEPT